MLLGHLLLVLAQGTGASASEVGSPAPLPDELRTVLTRVEELRSGNEVEEARRLLHELIGGELYASLMQDEVEVALEALTEIDSVASSLDLLDVVLEARQDVLRRLKEELPGDPRIPVAEFKLGSARSDVGDLEGALELLRSAHAEFERILPPDHSHLLKTKQNLATVLKEAGDLEQALELEEYVHEVREKSLPPEDANLLAIKLNLGGTRYGMGDLRGADELFQYVHEKWARLLPDEHPHLLIAKQALALTRGDLGDNESALELKEYVHAVQARTLPADHPSLIVAKSNLAITRDALGDAQGALELREVVHRAWTESLEPEHPELLRAKQNLAISRAATGDVAGALELDEYVLEVRERILPENHVDLVRTRNNLAYARALSGDRPGALELYDEVHTTWDTLLPRDHPDLLTAKVNLAMTHKALGHHVAAIELAHTVLESQRALARELAYAPPRVARATALGEIQRLAGVLYYGDTAELDREDSSLEIDSLLFTTLESLRSVSTASSKLALAASRSPELGELRDRLGAVRRELDDLTLSPPLEAIGEAGGAERLEGWRAQLVEIAERRDDLERDLRSKARDQGVLEPDPSATALAGRLAADAALISFLRYDRIASVNAETTGQERVDSVLAFVLAPSGEVERVELGATAPLVELAESWRAAMGRASIARGIRVEGVDEDALEEQVGNDLRSRLLDPCLAALAAAPPKTLHLILDDFLHSVPVDALPWGDGRRAGEVLRLGIEVSARRLLAAPRSLAANGTLVAMGGVSYDAPVAPVAERPDSMAGGAESGLRNALPGTFEELPGTLLEVRSIERLHGATFGIADASPIVLTGRDATETALVQSAPHARWLHVATHGWFAPVSVLSMREALQSEQRSSLDFGQAESTIRGFAAGTLCGLAFAGANDQATAARGAGIVTAEALSAIDLTNCELAVLSACETNVGIRRSGQGIQSLQSALHTAGARSAITSLWRVDDAATRRLMELFYTKLWTDELGKADALWQAKMALRAEGHPIRDWAGWVLTGDPD